MTTRIYHNPRCSKSRATLALLETHGIEHEVVEYLQAPPERAELEMLLRKLGCRAADIVRFNEPEFAQTGLSKDADDAALLAAIEQHPKLLQRPIVEHGERARIGRPPEAVLELFE
ncbi:MAG: arsenate reductase (glutaredoxin) [Gammaproteobacteria bacterium]|jgi:arsenate reductase